jgi:hypothetical protein
MIGRWISLAAVFTCACAVDVKGVPLGDDDDGGGSGSGSGVMPPPPGSNGIVQTPAHGATVTGDPQKATIHVSGVSTVASAQLSVQVLANPDDLTSWTTVGTATAGDPATGGYAFATDITPAADDKTRWPRGGILRLRVIDSTSTALPYDQDTNDTVIALTNPSLPPFTWTYLTEKGVGSQFDTDLYYQQINAPSTLGGFINRYQFSNFGDGEASARYYNQGDLGIGREMHCQSQSNGGLACYVRNFGQFGGLKVEALVDTVAAGTPLATVAMVYTPPITDPNAVTFMVYDGQNNLQDFAQLDVVGENQSVPENCIVCHDGHSNYDRNSHSVTGARFLAFDPKSFDYAAVGGFTFNDQDTKFGDLNALILDAAPTDAVQDLVAGIYPNGTFVDDYIPAQWRQTAADKQVYRDVIAPYCRTCHVSQNLGTANDPLEFTSAGQVLGAGQKIVQLICGKDRAMPEAEDTAIRFFNSGARGELLTFLNAPGACAP